jgi:hypothetical protein
MIDKALSTFSGDGSLMAGCRQAVAARGQRRPPRGRRPSAAERGRVRGRQRLG